MIEWFWHEFPTGGLAEPHGDSRGACTFRIHSQHASRAMKALSPRVEAHRLSANDPFPNNPRLPLLIYRQALDPAEEIDADEVERLLRTHQWGGTWKNGVFPYHHYHSNTHEVLVVCAGTARVQLGGPDAQVFAVEAGDVALLPAGTAHKRIEASDDFLVVGGYPAGQEDYDLIRDEPAKQQQAEQRIAAVPLPEHDPIYGPDGPLLQQWSQE